MSSSKIDGLISTTRNFIQDNKGVAAIEFVFIAPILILLYFVTVEIGFAIETKKKFERSTAMFADLISQNEVLTSADVDAIAKIGNSILQPYNRSSANYTVTTVQFDGEDPPVGRVVWSRKIDNGSSSTPFSADTVVTGEFPQSLRIGETFLIRVESEMTYFPIISWRSDQKESLGMDSAFDFINYATKSYTRARVSVSVPCDDCN